jgi:AraC family transcriptional regulator
MSDGSRSRLEYQNRVNRVIDHIQAHRADDLSLEVLAQVAAFSPFHFHRVFKGVTGENLKEYVQRVRLEWAASALIAWSHDDVTGIALDSGFQSASAFARAFKERFGMTATEWRSGGFAAWSKERQADRNPGQADRKDCDAADGGDGQAVPMNATVKTLPGYRIAYMRHVGPYGAGGAIPQLWMRLMRWAQARDLWTADRLCVGVAPDDPRIVAPEKCRYDAGIVVPSGVVTDTQVNVVDLQGGKFVCVPFTGTGADIGAAWDRLFAEWMPRSGYQPDDGPFLELYPGDAWDERTGVVRCELCTPVRPL